MKTLWRILAAANAALLAACGSDEAAPDIDEQPAEPILPAEAETVAPIEAPDAPAYIGVWALSADVCDAAPGSADPSPIALTEGEFIGYENFCRIGYAEEGTEGGWRLELICDAEGVEYMELAEVDVDGEMLRLKRGDAPETALVRCEGN